mmetsp:Transcript_3325/g.3777  ORF Transcript_3325/g.3777 Transcript_3325/m.3777 type:complete len:104 (+) Transcript_3325:789-1100(+)
MKNTRGVGEGMPSTVVGMDSEEQLDLRHLDGMGGRTVSIKFAVLGICDMARVTGWTVNIDAIPATGHPHRDLQLVTLGGRKEIVFRVTIAFTGRLVDAFRGGV